jgi:DNA-binding PadR family transcriptional regulator
VTLPADQADKAENPALARLIEDGLIRATQRPSPMAPPRRYLSLTASGKHHLAEMSHHWQGVCSSVETLTGALKKGEPDAVMTLQ